MIVLLRHSVPSMEVAVDIAGAACVKVEFRSIGIAVDGAVTSTSEALDKPKTFIKHTKKPVLPRLCFEHINVVET